MQTARRMEETNIGSTRKQRNKGSKQHTRRRCRRSHGRGEGRGSRRGSRWPKGADQHAGQRPADASGEGGRTCSRLGRLSLAQKTAVGGKSKGIYALRTRPRE